MARNGNGDKPRGVLAQLAKARRDLDRACDRIRDLEEVVQEHDQRLDELEQERRDLPTRRR